MTDIKRVHPKTTDTITHIKKAKFIFFMVHLQLFFDVDFFTDYVKT